MKTEFKADLTELESYPIVTGAINEAIHIILDDKAIPPQDAYDKRREWK